MDVVHYFYLMSRPPTEASYLKGVWEIETEQDSGYHWTISHPSFYLWNRLLTALMGTGSVLAAYLLARDLKGPWAGILSADLLAAIDTHVTHSSLVTPNVPASFFSLIGVGLSVRYARRGVPAFLIGAAAACGLAASTKYNAAVSIVAPLTALASTGSGLRPDHRGWLCAAVLLVPVVVFIMGTPFALLDLPHFVGGVGYEIRHDEVSGHPGKTIEPGLTHLLYQLGSLGRAIGPLPALFATLGLAAAFTTSTGWVTFIFPVAYLGFMSLTRVPEERNFVGLYPFASVSFGAGLVVALDRVRGSRLGARPRRVVEAALLLGAVAPCLLAGASSLSRSWRLANSPETRTQAIGKVNALQRDGGSTGRVGVAAELGVHRLDLARLKVPYDVAPLFDLLCGGRDAYDRIVTAKQFHDDRKDERDGVELMNSLASHGTSVLATLGPGQWFHLDYLNINPSILILSRAPQPTGCGSRRGPTLSSGTRAAARKGNT